MCFEIIVSKIEHLESERHPSTLSLNNFQGFPLNPIVVVAQQWQQIMGRISHKTHRVVKICCVDSFCWLSKRDEETG